MKVSATAVRFDDDSMWRLVRWPHDRRPLGVVSATPQRHARATRGGRDRPLRAALGGHRRGHFDRRIVAWARRPHSQTAASGQAGCDKGERGGHETLIARMKGYVGEARPLGTSARAAARKGRILIASGRMRSEFGRARRRRTTIDC